MEIRISKPKSIQSKESLIEGERDSLLLITHWARTILGF